MARPRSAAIALRNEQVYSLWKSGKSLAWLAEKYQRTPQQIGRIVAGFHPELDEDDDRSLHRGRLETLYEEVQGMISEPGWKLMPSGGVAHDDEGEPVVDMQARIEAAGLQLKVLESMRKLDARDRPQARVVQVEFSEAQRQAMADIQRRRAELEDLARRPGHAALQGEVVRELPPGQ